MNDNLTITQTSTQSAPQSPVAPMQPMVTSSLSPLIQPPNKSPRKKVILIVVLFVVIAIAILSTYLILGKSGNKKPTVVDEKNRQTLSTIDTTSIKSAYDGFFKNGIAEFDAKSKDKIIAIYADFTKDFKVSQQFATDKSILLISLGIAHQASLASEKDKEAYRYEMYLLAKPYLDTKPSNIVDDEFTETLSDQDAKAIYAKYTDKDLTKKVRETISSKNLLKDIDTKLKIGKSEQKTFELFVLNFDSKSSAEKQFAKEMKMTGWVPPLWNDKRSTFNYIIFSKDQAESFLDPSQQDSALGKILHEYTHSQTNYSRGEFITYALEERRAELFSGDTAAYYDVKGFITYIKVFSGVDILNLMEQYPSNPTDFYQTLYKTFGVNLANKIIMAIPVPYLVDVSNPVKQIQTISNNYNSALESAFKFGEKDETAQLSRIKDRADKLLKVFGTKEKVISDLQNNTKDNYKLDYAAKKMIDYFN